MRAGKFIKATSISPAISDETLVPCFGGNGLRGFVSVANEDSAALIIGRQGALCGNVNFVTGAFYATEHAVVTRPTVGIDIGWAFQKLTSLNLNQFATKSAQPGLAVGTIQKISIAVPRIEEQIRIGQLLNEFEKFTGDLSSGLPAEIAARRKQYEYYRDKLLTFKEAA